MPYQIRRVAVIGAGTMGAAIAGLVAGTGIPVLLLDVPPTSLTPEEEARGLTLSHPAVRNRIVQAGYDRMVKAKPANLLSARTAELITLGNTEDDFAKLADADWIVEAIIEQVGMKQTLMARLEQVRKPGSLVTTNTSGIPIAVIAEGRSAEFKAHFFGTHFFNPPRYLKLMELIPGADTDPAAVAAMRAFAENTLGKGVVVCKDRPNFIGNRLGVFLMMNDLPFILQGGYTVEEVDALTGPLIGRPSTASFRLLDQVGIDVIAYVAHNLYDAVPDDESREIYRSSDLLDRMVAAKMLGKKTGVGFYKEVREGGKRQFWPLDLQSLEHRPETGTASVQALIDEAQRIRSLPERMRFILKRAAEDPHDRGAQLIAHTTLNSLAYASRRLPEIADSVADADSAMRWGFAHELGPFQLWDALGVAETAAMMRERGIAVAPWVDELIAREGRFYGTQDGAATAYNVSSGSAEVIYRDPRAIDLAALKALGRELEVRATQPSLELPTPAAPSVTAASPQRSASLIDLGDGVLCLEFHSKANAVNGEIVEMGHAALEELKNDRWVGLVVGNQGRMFCAGADLKEFVGFIQSGNWDAVDAAVRRYQQWMMGMRYAPKPVVTAPFAQVLGGGCEVAMHSARTVAAGETYMGLVEVGVGLLPAAGGCKELNRRIIGGAAAIPGSDPLKAFQQVFEMISTAKVSTSAVEAREMGLLRPTDQIVMNGDYLIGEAKLAVLELAKSYAPPIPGKHCYALGRDGLAAAKVAIYGFVQGGFASEHDGFIAQQIAHVLCGGELSSAQWVDEQYILDLEREAFKILIQQPKSQERIRAMLETGKPLRN